jgi:UDP-glucose:(heptosyl)LPS alpha-1,3-glucosyltransferase
MKNLALVSRRVQGLSGAVSLILAEAAAAVGAGWNVHVIAETIDPKAIRNIGAVPIKIPGWPWGSWFKRRVFAHLAGRAAHAYDLVHGHGDLLQQDILSLHNGVHAAYEATHHASLPPHDAVGRMHALQLAQNRFRVLVVNSQLLRRDVIRRFGVPDQSIRTVYPGYDETRFNAHERSWRGASLRQELGLQNDHLLFGLVTSGDFEKRGVTPFLRAFSLVAKSQPQARAIVVGKETRLGPYRRLVSELEMESKVFFREPQFNVENTYHALDVSVHAAAWEEFGMTVLESMACGVPVVASSRVGAAELITGEALQFVLPEPSVEAMAAAMLGLSPQRRCTSSANSSTVWLCQQPTPSR